MKKIALIITILLGVNEITHAQRFRCTNSVNCEVQLTVFAYCDNCADEPYIFTTTVQPLTSFQCNDGSTSCPWNNDPTENCGGTNTWHYEYVTFNQPCAVYSGTGYAPSGCNWDMAWVGGVAKAGVSGTPCVTTIHDPFSTTPPYLSTLSSNNCFEIYQPNDCDVCLYPNTVNGSFSQDYVGSQSAANYIGATLQLTP